MGYRTDLSRVIGLGSARDGVAHWWSQRVTALALVPLVVLGVPPLAGAIGGAHADVLATYRDPFNAIIAILLIAVMFRHLALGLQVVIEDYVHGKAMRAALLLANTLGCAFFGLTGVFAVARIAFSG